jgi:Zn-dependent M28 family amino/carboxypeptidase
MALEKSNAEKTTPSPAFVISKNMAADMIGISEKNLLKYLEGKKIKFPKDKTNISVKSERGQDLIETANIMGFIEGTDKKDEVVVLTAHYDHVGIDDKGQIYNGADDDGSGTCAILELAQAYSIAKANGHGPRRSILFMTVTGEEKGLLGSKYYTDVAPVIPLDKTIVDLNIDMIGRVDKKHESNPNYVYVIGSDKLSSELHRISEDANKNSINFELDYEFNSPTDPNKFYYRSDHYNFAKNKIPVIFYFTGVHEDYHKPGDDVEKILFEKYSSIVKLVFNTSWELANRDNKIVVDSNKP